MLTQDRTAPQVSDDPLETVSYFQYSRKERGVVISNDFHFLVGFRGTGGVKYFAVIT